MKITDIETILLPDVPFPEPIEAAWSPGQLWHGLSLMVVKVHTDEGITGVSVGSARSLSKLQNQVIPELTGADPLLIEMHQLFLGKVGGVWVVELALWDLLGKAAGLPLSRLWGGYCGKIRAYASVTEVGSPEKRAEDALAFLEDGFRGVKLRLHNDTPEEDVALVQAVREAVGDRMAIMVDANQANVVPGHEMGPVWNLQRAIWTAKALEALGVEWLEEPLHRYDFSALAELAEVVRLPIAGGENNRDLRDFVHMVSIGAYDIFQADLMVAGVSNCRKVASIAEAAGKLAVGHHGGTGVGMVARLHLNASVSNGPWLEYFYDPPKFTPKVFQGMIAEPLWPDADGYLHVPNQPGLGIELDESFITHYAA